LIFILDKLNYGLQNIAVPSFISWILLVFWGLFEVTASFNKFEGLHYYYITILIPFLLFIIINNIRLDISFFDKFFHLLFVSGVILTVASLIILSSKGFEFTSRIPSLWYHYNLVAAYFMVLLFFNLSFIVNSKKSRKTVFYIISLLLILFGLIMTQTRGIWLATLAGIAFYILKRPKLLLPVSIVTMLIFFAFYSVVMDRILSVVNFSYDVSSIGRLQAWIASAVLIKENLLLGYGFDSFRFLRDSVFTVYFVILPHPHNTYLTLALDLGLIGFLLYFSFFVKAFYYSLILRKNSTDSSVNKYLDGLQLSFVGFLVAFMFEPYFTVLGVITYVLWLLISMSFFFRHNPNLK
jgi:O-antigen ligase